MRIREFRVSDGASFRIPCKTKFEASHAEFNNNALVSTRQSVFVISITFFAKSIDKRQILEYNKSVLRIKKQVRKTFSFRKGTEL